MREVIEMEIIDGFTEVREIPWRTIRPESNNLGFGTQFLRASQQVSVS